MLKPGPEAFPCVMEILAEPALVRVMDEVPLAPTTTLPKLTFAGFAVRLP